VVFGIPGDAEAPPAPPAAGEEHLLVYQVMEGIVPEDDPAESYQYGFVFDADGAPGNDYQASSAYPNDFFQGSDLWYVASYDPAAGWSLDVTLARDGAFTALESDAVVLVEGDTLVLVAPAADFEVDDPAFRVTAFRHGGDWGMADPYDWSGDAEPPVDEGLAGFGGRGY